MGQMVHVIRWGSRREGYGCLASNDMFVPVIHIFLHRILDQGKEYVEEDVPEMYNHIKSVTYNFRVHKKTL